MRAGNPFKLALCLALAIPFALAACGGGGGGAPAKTAMTPTPGGMDDPPTPGGMDDPPAPDTWPKRTEAEFGRVATAGAEKMVEIAAGLADADPNFGSITQSTQGPIRVITHLDNDASNPLTWESLTLSATPGSGSGQGINCGFSCYWNINSVHRVNELTRQASRTLGNLTHTYQPLRVNFKSQVEQNVSIESHRSFPHFYPPKKAHFGTVETTISAWSAIHGDDETLIRSNITQRISEGSRSIRGYYLAYAGRNLISTAPTIQDMELGVFVDGEDYNPRNELLLGSNITGRYVGDASGLIVMKHQGGIAAGDWNGVVNLYADFADNSIRGEIGANVRSYAPRQTSETPPRNYIYHTQMYSGDVEDFRIKLQNTWLGQVPSMAFHTIILEKATFGVTTAKGFVGDARMLGTKESAGKWGGTFSNIRIQGTNPAIPSAVAGTIGVHSTLHNNDTITFGGTFEAGYHENILEGLNPIGRNY